MSNFNNINYKKSLTSKLIKIKMENKIFKVFPFLNQEFWMNFINNNNNNNQKKNI